MSIEVGKKYTFHCSFTDMAAKHVADSPFLSRFAAHTGHIVTVERVFEGTDKIFYVRAEDDWTAVVFEGELEAIR